MAGQLLVRAYNVGCGDCIYVRIPEGEDGFHILIDCGSKEAESKGILKRCVEHLKSQLPPDSVLDGKKRLDLLVATHLHEDHIKGFDPTYFAGISIKRIWLTAAMNPAHPQAQKSQALHRAAAAAMASLTKRPGFELSPELQDLVGLYGIDRAGANRALTEDLPAANNIAPTYVHANTAHDELDIELDDTKIHVLAPEENIDFYYLGEELATTLRGVTQVTTQPSPPPTEENQQLPSNISPQDFRKLRSRMLSNGLAFAVGDTKIQNNASVVLLMEWRGRRLLFVGDAEWDSEFKEGSKNGSWNVMWHRRRELLASPLDFLKIGHHGSHNATPWNRHENADHEVNQILEAILPLPAEGERPTAQCIVSTKRKQYDTIPDGELLVELGKRVRNTKNYLEELSASTPGFDPFNDVFNFDRLKTYSVPPSPRQVGEKDWLDKRQPIRTDMESVGRGDSEIAQIVEFQDVLIDPGD